MSRVLALAAFLCAWCFGASTHAAEPTHVRRFALVVGANDGGDDRVMLRYAGTDAKAVAKVLAQIGGVDKRDAVVVLQPTPDGLREQLAEIGRRIAEADVDTRTQFVFYYSGHSDERGLLLAGQRIGYAELRELIHAIPADVRIGVLDSCSSGAFTRTKGGQRRAPFLVAAADVAGHAFLTSSSVDEAAQESDRVRGSFFTHFFVSGLRGAADHNADRLVTLDEAYRFAFGETLASTESSTAGAQHAAYEIQLAGTGDLVMTDLRKTTAGLALAPEIHGRVYVRDAGGTLAGELYKPPAGGTVELALEPGKYSIVVDGGDELRRALVVLVHGKTTKLAGNQLVRFAGETNTTHGAGGDPEYRRIPVTTSLFPPVSVNAREKHRKVENNFAMNWLLGKTDRVRGVELSFGGNWVKEDLRGAQLGIGANVVGKEMRGLQWSVGANVARGGFRGLQMTAGVNVASTARADDPLVPMRGVQLGFVNVAKGKLSGTQIGLVNIGDDVDASIGLITISRKHGVGGEFWTDDIATLNLGLRMRARKTYTILSVNVHPFPERLGGHFGFGLAIGGRIEAGRRAFVDIDVGGRWAAPGFVHFSSTPTVVVLRTMVGVKFTKRIALFGGPTFGVEIASANQWPNFRPGYQYEVYHVRKGPLMLRMWPGFAFGLQF